MVCLIEARAFDFLLHKNQSCDFDLASYIRCLLLHLFVITSKSHSFDVQPSYNQFLVDPVSYIYPVDVCKDCSCFVQLIDYNSKDVVQNLTKIGANNCPWMPNIFAKF